MPSSCEDLLHIGHKLNGLHLITRVGTVETVYCDFSKSPRTGKCFFSFTGLARFPASSAYKLRLGVGLYLNGYLHGRGWVANTGNNHWGQFTLQSTLDLNSGDRVWLQITDVSDGVYLYDNGNHYTHFTGWLLQLIADTKGFNSCTATGTA